MAVGLNEKQKALLGKWKHESAENVDNYLKKVGIGMILRKVAQTQKPTVKFVVEADGKWHIYIESAFKNHDWSFKIGEKFKFLTIDGRTFWCTYSWSPDGKLVETQEVFEGEPKNIPAVTARWVEDGKLLITETAPEGTTSKRFFTRLE